MASALHPPKLTVADLPEPIAICALAIDVRVSGFEIESTWTMTFRNPHPRVLEGSLEFPLPEGGTVTGYAVEAASGRLLDAIPVESDTARVAFEEAVREGREAGLAEVKAGNAFNVRVYPIPASGTKRVRVTAIAPLASPHFAVPAIGPEPLDTFELTLGVLGGLAARVEDDGDAKFSEMGSAESGLASLTTGVVERFALTRPVVFDVPFADLEARSEPVVTMCRGHPSAPGDTFFVICDVLPPAPVADETAAATTDAPRATAVAVLYDLSLSRAARGERAVEEKTLSAILIAAAQQGVKRADLVFLRDKPSEARQFDLSSGGVDDLLGAIEGEPADGGTSLREVNSVLRREGAPVYRWAVMFTDGFANLGAEAPEGDAPCPMHVVTANAKANHSFLNYIAQKSGACFFDASSPVFTSKIALEALAQEKPFGFLRTTASDSVHEVYPAHPVPITGTARHFVVAGRLKSDQGTVTIQYGRGSFVERTITVGLNSAKAVSASTQICRTWARLKVDELAALGDERKSEIVALARTYGFVCSGTSLLVLETLEEYRRHGIEPNVQALPEIHREYTAEIRRKEEAESARVSKKLQQWTSAWERRVSWWKEEFSSSEKITLQKERETRAEQRREHLQKERTRVQEVDRAEAQQYESKIAAIQAQIDLLQPPRKSQMSDESKEKCHLEEKEKKCERECMKKESKKKCKSRSRAVEEECCLMQCAPQMAMPCAAPSCAAPLCEMAPPPPAPAVGGPMPPPPPGGAQFDQVSEECEEECDDAPAPSPAAAPRPAAPSAGISLKAWDPSTPYLEKIKTAGESVSAAYREYILQRDSYATSPAFFLDVSEYFSRKLRSKEVAMKVLTSILDIGIEEPQLYRIVGYKLDEFGELFMAISVFERVLKLRQSEPQSFRDLGLVLIKAGRFQEAFDKLWKVVTGSWDDRFNEIELTALTEINRLLWLAKQKQVEVVLPKEMSSKFITPVDVDVRISMAWDTDMTDVDLHVIEPTGEECYFAHNSTQIGGMLSRDFRQGYGPEEYMCHNAASGKYVIRAKYYASHQQNLSGGTTILLSVFTNFSRENEHSELITIRLAQSTDIVDVGEVLFEKNDAKIAAALAKLRQEEDEKDQKELKALVDQLEKNSAAARTRMAAQLKEKEAELEHTKTKNSKKPEEPSVSEKPADTDKPVETHPNQNKVPDTVAQPNEQQKQHSAKNKKDCIVM